MSDMEKINWEKFNYKWEKIASKIRRMAKENQGNIEAILSLLRLLESLHREIRDGIFQESLPDNRQALYNLLKYLENSGGWPYIYRGNLQAMLAKLSKEDANYLLNERQQESSSLLQDSPEK